MTLIQFAPAVLAVFIFLYQHKIFVTPETLERKHREILEDAEKKFATLHMFNNLHAQFNDMKGKIDKIYDHLIKKENL